MFGAEIWGPILASTASSFLTNQGRAPSETKTQKSQGKLIDQLLASVNGNGPFSDLFNANEDAFQKSFVQPAQARFRNQIAPQIQQSYIASGQQRGTGLDDQLLRAGVDLNSMLDQYQYQFQNDAMNRKQNTINGILGQGAGASNQTSPGQDVMSGLGGYLASPGFSDSFSNLLNKNKPQGVDQYMPRKGFAQ